MRESKQEIMNGIEDVVTSKLIDNNTVQYWNTKQEKIIRLHRTNIITYKPSGEIVLDSGGWLTPTTRDRLNHYLKGIHIYTENRIWYVIMNNIKYGFKDGLVINQKRQVFNSEKNIRTKTDLNRRIKKYIDDYIKALFEGQVPKPSAGDCWYCVMRTENDISLGDAISDTEHLLNHIEEKYYVPSLIVNAIEENPVSHIAQHNLYTLWETEDDLLMPDVGKSQLKRSLGTYLRTRLGFAR